MLYHPLGKSNMLVNPNFLSFTNEKLNRDSDEKRSIKQLYLNDLQLFKYGPAEKKETMSGEAGGS